MQIKEDPKHTGKKYYVDFKRRVWHTAMKYVLETMEDPSRLGAWIHLHLANRDLQLFPRFPILSCDYEEASVPMLFPCIAFIDIMDSAMMVLIRGVNGKAPCPICLVPKLEQNNLETEYELRTSERTREILQIARGLRTQELRDDYLGEFGLRNIDVSFFLHYEKCSNKPLAFRTSFGLLWHVIHSGPFLGIGYTAFRMVSLGITFEEKLSIVSKILDMLLLVKLMISKLLFMSDASLNLQCF